MFSIAPLMAAIDRLSRRTVFRRRIEYVSGSRTVTVQKDGWLVLRVMGAGGGGAWGSYANGGTAGTVGVKRLAVKAGQQFVIVIPAGGQGTRGTPGNAGGTLTINGPGVAITVPGGTGGSYNVAGGSAAPAAVPTGLDWYILGAPAVAHASSTTSATGGGAAALLGRPVAAQVGGTGPFGGSGVGGPATQNLGAGSGVGARGLLDSSGTEPAALDHDHSVLLINVSGGSGSTDGGPGAGGRASLNTSTPAGAGGFGAGGGAAGVSSCDGGSGGRGGGGGASSSSTPGATGGNGGAGWVTCEFLETQP